MRRAFTPTTFPELARGVGLCLKYRHATAIAARRVLAMQKARANETRPKRLNVYFCSRCSAYHVGHRS